MINKGRIKRSFNTHARSYDQSAHLQQKVATEVIERVKALGIYPTCLLDIGTGTGYVALALKKLFPSANSQACDIAYGMIMVAKAKGERLFFNQLDFISADAEYLPYQGRKFDLVSSSLTYQWLDNWRYAFREVLRVLQVGGIFLFTTLGDRTLFELRDSYLHSYRELRNGGTPDLHDFIRRDTLHTLLTEEGFVEVSVESRLEKQYHDGVKDLLTHLRAIGAQNASQQNISGLGKPKVFGRMVDIYQDQYGNGLGIPATFELLFGFGRKA
jgi:malonyl-CoA O-methyltransferase